MSGFADIWNGITGTTTKAPTVTTTTDTKSNTGMIIGGVVLGILVVVGIIFFLNKEG